MTSIFQREAYQYDHAVVKLPVYLEKYAGGEWELRSTIRKDTRARCDIGLPVKKTVSLRKPKVMEVTIRQMELVLLAMNNRKAFNPLSRDILLGIDEIGDGFNSGDLALALFGPSDKSYEKGNKEQSVKQKIRRLEHHNVLLLKKMKYYRLPVWLPFIQMIRTADEKKRFDRSMPW